MQKCVYTFVAKTFKRIRNVPVQLFRKGCRRANCSAYFRIKISADFFEMKNMKLLNKQKSLVVINQNHFF